MGVAVSVTVSSIHTLAAIPFPQKVQLLDGQSSESRILVGKRYLLVDRLLKPCFWIVAW
jgi:hypothetical protein